MPNTLSLCIHAGKLRFFIFIFEAQFRPLFQAVADPRHAHFTAALGRVRCGGYAHGNGSREVRAGGGGIGGGGGGGGDDDDGDDDDDGVVMVVA